MNKRYCELCNKDWQVPIEVMDRELYIGPYCQHKSIGKELIEKIKREKRLKRKRG